MKRCLLVTEVKVQEVEVRDVVEVATFGVCNQAPVANSDDILEAQHEIHHIRPIKVTEDGEAPVYLAWSPLVEQTLEKPLNQLVALQDSDIAKSRRILYLEDEIVNLEDRLRKKEAEFKLLDEMPWYKVIVRRLIKRAIG